MGQNKVMPPMLVSDLEGVYFCGKLNVKLLPSE